MQYRPKKDTDSNLNGATSIRGRFFRTSLESDVLSPIARIMALNPAVVVLDEPTAMLDVLTQARIMSLLEGIQKETQVGYVLVSHDLSLIQGFCSHIFRLENGTLA